MTEVDELTKMLSAERAQRPTEERIELGLRGLSSALSADAPALAVAHGPLKLGMGVATKSLLGSGLVAFAVTGAGLGVYSVTRPDSVDAVAPLVASAAPLVSSAAGRAPAPSVAQAAPAPPSPSSAVAPAPTLFGASSGADSLAEELRLMKAAKRELDAGRDHLAGVWLEQHARLYPSGALRSERQGLEVLLRCRRSPDEGREAARTFMLHNRQSPLVDRIVRACSIGPTSPDGEKSSGSK
jgi:hypothetical protein